MSGSVRRIKSLEELRIIKEKARRSMGVVAGWPSVVGPEQRTLHGGTSSTSGAPAARPGRAGTRVTIRLGSCSIAMGADRVLKAIVKELYSRGIWDVSVKKTGCPGLCEGEPFVDVERPGCPRATYAYVTPDMARRIVAQHIVNGSIVSEWLVQNTPLAGE
ncbi:MAG: (2Fe-2S) ferredoxin domain-containing protein [Firmicutes bacterium]|nr:(2Fe-2S) ferredoxin domain-containing protein [Bacillota bacterium]